MLPLDGITVVSLEQAVAGPFATRQLADLGARVIKIERTGAGDFARGYDRTVLGESSYFVWLNRSKESVALDLKDARGRQIVSRLVAGSDVFLQNLAPGACKRLGFDNSSLAHDHPSLIVCSLSGYGSDGPWADRKAYDLLVQSEVGLLSLTGTEQSVAKVGVSIADIAAGMYAFSAILASLYQRAVTGRGSLIDLSMFEALSEWIGAQMYYTMYSGAQPQRTGADHATIAPYGPFVTSDGKTVVIAIQNDREWESFCKNVLTDEQLVTDERFADNPARSHNREALRKLIEGRLRALSGSEVEDLLADAGIAMAEVNLVEQFLRHPVLSGRNRWRKVETPRGVVTALVPPGIPVGAEPVMGPVPAVGQHTEAVLAELGLSDQDIGALKADGVVSVPSARSAGGGR